MTTENPRPVPAAEAPAAKLPIDIPTFVLGLWRRRYLMLLTVPLAVFLAFVSSAKFGSRSYSAQTVLMYEPPGQLEETGVAVSLNTLVDMVTSQGNLTAVRQRLKLPVSLKALGKAVKTELRRKTTLLTVSVIWDDPETAALVANDLSEVFIDFVRRMKNDKAGTQASDLTTRLDAVREQLATADREYQAFTVENRIVDLDKEAEWYLEQLTSLNAVYDQAVAKQRSITRQRSSVDGLVEGIRKRASKEESELAAAAASTTEANVKIQRLRERISDQRIRKARAADLAVWEQEMARGKELYELGALPKSEFERITAEYERAKVMSNDSPDIIQWKKQITELDERVVPKAGGTSTPTGQFLQTVMQRVFDIQLSEIALEEEVKSLAESRQRTEDRLQKIPLVKRELVELLRRVETLEREKTALESRLQDARRLLDSTDIKWSVLALATPPAYPRASNRKLLFLAVLVLVCGVGGALVVLLELVDTSIKSERDLAAKLPVSVLASFLHCPQPGSLVPSVAGEDTPHQEVYRLLALRLRRLVPRQGARILIAGTTAGQGSTTVAVNLAAALGRCDERVLLMDAESREDQSPQSKPRLTLARFIDAEPPIPGLGGYLAFETDELSEITCNTVFPGVACIPRTKAPIFPEQFRSHRLHELLEETSRTYGVVLIDTPPIEPYADVEYLAEQADAVVLVVRSRGLSWRRERRACRRLADAGIPVICAVLTDVHPLYSHLQAQSAPRP